MSMIRDQDRTKLVKELTHFENVMRHIEKRLVLCDDTDCRQVIIFTNAETAHLLHMGKYLVSSLTRYESTKQGNMLLYAIKLLTGDQHTSA